MKRDLLAYSFLIVLALWVAFHLAVLVVYQEAIISERNRWASIPELAFTVGLLVLGLERWVNWVRRSRRGNN